VLSFPWPLRMLFAAQPQWLSRVLGVVIRAVSTALLKRAGVRHCDGARTGMVTYIQRFGSKLNLNVHLHVLALDGAPQNIDPGFKHGKARFHRAGGLRPEELEALLRTVITRVTRTLVRAGVLVAEDEQPYLDLEMDSPYEQLAGAAIRYVIAAGPQAGRATMRLRDPLLAAQPIPSCCCRAECMQPSAAHFACSHSGPTSRLHAARCSAYVGPWPRFCEPDRTRTALPGIRPVPSGHLNMRRSRRGLGVGAQLPKLIVYL
jgi:hypothetical protein